MDSPVPTSRKIVDLRAVLWAGIVAGLLFLLVNMFLGQLVLGTPWIFPRMVAAMVLDESILPPPATFDPLVLVVAVVIHLILSVVFTAILAFIVHRWGMLVAILVGAAFGLALYAINFYTFSYFFPWFFPLRSWMLVASHIVYGAVAGGMYEALEVDLYETVES